MKILNVKVTNFGSYQGLEFNFDNQGLCLISGSTGAGKSTLLDAVCWILYSCTAKNGSVEDVKSWKAEGEPTIGEAIVQLPSGTRIRVVRRRGSANTNDCHWSEQRDGNSDFSEHTRGKDLNDTQRLLEARLGLTADQFIASSYLHEFSSVGTFFTSTSKARRTLLEGLTDLSLPIQISSRSSEARKSDKIRHRELSDSKNLNSGRIDQLRQSGSSTKESSGKWRKDQKEKIEDLKVKAEAYEADKAHRIELGRAKHQEWRLGRLEQLLALERTAMRLKEIVKDTKQFDLEEASIRNSLRCGECGSLPDNVNEALIDCKERKTKNSSNIKELSNTNVRIKEVRLSENPHSVDLEVGNPHRDLLREVKKSVNPFDAQYHKLQIMIRDTEKELKGLTGEIETLEKRIAALSHLYDLSFILRGELLNKAITELQDSTNAYLERYFDAELRVGFEMKDSDTLDVVIHKSGYECNFKQLSRGQRALLKICFGISVMKSTANQAGYHPNVLMFDEILDGCDTELKMKAVSLLEQLSTEHDTVLVIDHCTEVKASFNKNYIVELINDESVISEN